DTVYILGDFRPTLLLSGDVLFGVFRKVIGHGSLTRQTPDHRISSPARDEISPVFFDFGNTHDGQEITPAGDDARSQPNFDGVSDAQIGRVEVGGIDARVIRFPGESRLVRSPRVERR